MVLKVVEKSKSVILMCHHPYPGQSENTVADRSSPRWGEKNIDFFGKNFSQMSPARKKMFQMYLLFSLETCISK